MKNITDSSVFPEEKLYLHNFENCLNSESSQKEFTEEINKVIEKFRTETDSDFGIIFFKETGNNYLIIDYAVLIIAFLNLLKENPFSQEIFNKIRKRLSPEDDMNNNLIIDFLVILAKKKLIYLNNIPHYYNYYSLCVTNEKYNFITNLKSVNVNYSKYDEFSSNKNLITKEYVYKSKMDRGKNNKYHSIKKFSLYIEYFNK